MDKQTDNKEYHNTFATSLAEVTIRSSVQRLVSVKKTDVNKFDEFKKERLS